MASEKQIEANRLNAEIMCRIQLYGVEPARRLILLGECRNQRHITKPLQ